MTELEQASRYAKLLVASLEEASDVEEALMAAELAMEFKESEHPRNKDGEFNNKKASKGAASLGKNYRKALTVLNSQVTWHDKSQESKQAMIDALAESPASRLKREYNEFEDIYLETQGNLHRTGHSGVAEDEANSTDESTRGRQEDYLAKLRDFGARMELLEAALEKGHKLRMDDEGRWKVIELSLEAYFAFDIFNRQAQGILNRAMKAAKGLSRQAKESLIAALKLPSPTEVAHAVVQFVEKYRIQLARLLTTTQLAAVLEGAKEVAKKLPVIPPDGLGAPLPASISPAETTELVERIRQMPEEERWRTVYSLPADQQRFVLAQMRISGGIAPPPVLQAPADEDEGIHFPIIDEAVRELSSKNVIDRYSFDRLDAAARQKAFTVARVDADETLIRIRDALAENVRTGADFETFKESVLQDVEAGTFMSDGHLENVFRTNVQTAFSDGQMNVLSMPFVKSGFPYVAYEAIHDDRVEADHLAMESHGIAGTNIFRIDDPVFQLFRPPWRWMCRCSYIPYTVQMAARAGIEEAKTWLETGIEPTPPAYVQMPPFQPPPGFRRSLNAAPLSIQLSLQLPSTWRDRLKGGLADKKTPADFDKESLLEGMRIELEHTDDPLIALEIAMDHLTEDSEYYRKLKKVEE